MSEITYSDYLTRPNLNVAATIALALSLSSAASPRFTERCGAALHAMNACRAALETGWRRQIVQVTENSRPAQRECGTAWTVVVERVRLAGKLSAPRYKRHAAATALYEVLAPDGLEVAKLPFQTQWTTQGTRLRIIGEQGLMADLCAFAGEDFVAELMRAHTELGRVLGITESREAKEDVNLAELLRALNLTLTDYVLQSAHVRATRQARDAARGAARARTH